MVYARSIVTTKVDAYSHIELHLVLRSIIRELLLYDE